MPGGPWSPEEIADWHSAQGSAGDTADSEAEAEPVPGHSAETFGHFDPAIDLETAIGDARFAGNHPFCCWQRLMVEQHHLDNETILADVRALTDGDTANMKQFAEGHHEFFMQRLQRLT
eukprot:3489256-Heterocapsa_arctica.AAC.1